MSRATFPARAASAAPRAASAAPRAALFALPALLAALAFLPLAHADQVYNIVNMSGVDDMARCLDGSPYIFYVAPGDENVMLWWVPPQRTTAPVLIL
jgi:hypothetical protein